MLPSVDFNCSLPNETTTSETILSVSIDAIDKSSIPQSVLEEFQNECSSFLKLKITIKFEQGSASNSPTNIMAKANNKKLSSAQSSITNDLGIQDIMKKFNGKIQDGSIKPIDQ